MSLDPNGNALEAIANADVHDVGHHHTDLKETKSKDGNNYLVDEKLAVGSSTSGEDHEDADYEGKPTAEELATLRRVSGKIDWSAYLIAFIEL